MLETLKEALDVRALRRTRKFGHRGPKRTTEEQGFSRNSYGEAIGGRVAKELAAAKAEI